MAHRILPLLLLASAPLTADTLLGGEVGVYYWGHGAKGSYGESSEQTRFNFSDDGSAVFYLALEHPIPLVPNLKLRHNPLHSEGRVSLNDDFSLDGTSFPAGSAVITEMDATQTDIILYYEILDNSLIALDLGANLKWLDGEALARSATLQANQPFTAAVPTLYGRLRADLWSTGLYGTAEANYLSFDGSQLSDFQFALGYTLIDDLTIALSLEMGYRVIDLQVEDVDNLYTNLKFNGAWLGVALDF